MNLKKSNQSMKSQKSHAFFPNDVEGSNLNVPTVLTVAVLVFVTSC